MKLFDIKIKIWTAEVIFAWISEDSDAITLPSFMPAISLPLNGVTFPATFISGKLIIGLFILQNFN